MKETVFKLQNSASSAGGIIRPFNTKKRRLDLVKLAHKAVEL
jgi:hypothetical protein